MTSTTETGPDAPTTPDAAAPAEVRARPAEVTREAARRRTFAVISHPDAGKSTLTEALALHARVISEAGAVHGKAGRRSTVSDWMEMERARGISITSAALQFEYDAHVVNLVDTPGHADFSEDTYRVLSAVDAAVMLVDAAKGLEPQTLKLFRVCKHRGLPVITVINKWDRPGLDALELMDQIQEQIGLRPTPLTWPVGIAGDFRGVLDRSTGDLVAYTRTAGGATRAPEEHLPAAAAAQREGTAWDDAVEEHELLSADGADHDQDAFLAGVTTPVIFASAILNFGVATLLNTLIELSPPPLPFTVVDPDAGSAPRGAGTPTDAAVAAADAATAPARTRPVEAPFSAFVFKVQAGMDTAHRDRLAFARVCSGVFHRGMVVTHAQTGRPFATKYAQAMFGRERAVLDLAYPGDIIGLVNANALTVGDTIYLDEPVTFPPIASFAPEHFAVVRAVDSGRYKQFRRGIEQLDSEGVVQVLRSDLRGVQAPVLAAVGPMQFEVATSRMQGEFNAAVRLEELSYTQARRTDAASAAELDRLRGVEVLQRSDGSLLALALDKWRVHSVHRDHPHLTLESLVAGEG
ncbi:peptide chain release factor 3 [Nocardioides mesophilus]|uniref:Peptide chain release factor 3 n=1 Tax=Nocardioides mesophilus TaxID=433659 RepID=A0A7G9RF72_9ACTN|nr:GTP-binding protein [Nocardioides mesophilus]QNN54247.1 GTP-binding protein [Nocardioides mesophilus]